MGLLELNHHKFSGVEIRDLKRALTLIPMVAGRKVTINATEKAGNLWAKMVLSGAKSKDRPCRSVLLAKNGLHAWLPG